jgi:hypothetical protein
MGTLIIDQQDTPALCPANRAFLHFIFISHLLCPANPVNDFVGKKVFTFKKILPGRRVNYNVTRGLRTG